MKCNKKGINPFLPALSFCLLFAFQAGAVDIPFFEDFESNQSVNYTIDAAGKYTSERITQMAVADANQSIKTDTDGSRYYCAEKNAAAKEVAFRSFGGGMTSQIKGKLAFEFDMRLTNTYGAPAFTGRFPLGSSPYFLTFFSITEKTSNVNMTVSLASGDTNGSSGNRIAMCDIDVNHWYRYIYILDTSTMYPTSDPAVAQVRQELRVIDRDSGVLLAAQNALIHIPTDFFSRSNDRFRLQYGNWGTIDLDNLSMYKIEPDTPVAQVLPFAVDKSKIQDGRILSPKDGCFPFLFTNPIQTGAAGNPFTVYRSMPDGSEEVPAGEYAAIWSSNGVILKMNGDLEYTKTYTITFDPSTAVSYGGISLTEPVTIVNAVETGVNVSVLNFKNGGSVIHSVDDWMDTTKACANITAAKSRALTLITVLSRDTDGDGSCDTAEQIKSEPFSVEAGDSEKYFALPEWERTAGETYRLDMYIYDMENGMKLIGNSASLD